MGALGRGQSFGEGQVYSSRSLPQGKLDQGSGIWKRFRCTIVLA